MLMKSKSIIKCFYRRVLRMTAKQSTMMVNWQSSVKTRYLLTSITWPFWVLWFKTQWGWVFFQAGRCPGTGFWLNRRIEQGSEYSRGKEWGTYKGRTLASKIFIAECSLDKSLTILFYGSSTFRLCQYICQYIQSNPNKRPPSGKWIKAILKGV